MLYSKQAHSKSGSGFFFEDDVNAPADSIKVSEDDFQLAISLPKTERYTFKNRKGEEFGKLEIYEVQIDKVAALADAKTNASVLIDQFHSDVISRLVGNPTQTEKDTWAMKLDTANAIASCQTLSASGAAFLHAADLNDTTAQNNWARTVLAKSTGYAQVVGLAERLRDSAKTAVKAANDEAGVQAALDAQHAAANAAVASISKS